MTKILSDTLIPGTFRVTGWMTSGSGDDKLFKCERYRHITIGSLMAVPRTSEAPFPIWTGLSLESEIIDETTESLN